MDRHFRLSSCYQRLSSWYIPLAPSALGTHLPTPEGWTAELAVDL